MKIRFDHLKFGDAFGIRYQFEKAGDRIPAHSHDRSTAHVILVMQGKVKFFDCDLNYWVELTPGCTFEFDWTHRHEIYALRPETIIFNLFLYGQPPGYEDLPDHEKHGVIEID